MGSGKLQPTYCLDHLNDLALLAKMSGLDNSTVHCTTGGLEDEKEISSAHLLIGGIIQMEASLIC